jgi:hypothetical protein
MPGALSAFAGMTNINFKNYRKPVFAGIMALLP